MRENSEIEFREKKAERYAQAMQYCDEYRIAYCDLRLNCHSRWSETGSAYLVRQTHPSNSD